MVAGVARNSARLNGVLGVVIPMGRPFGIMPDDDGGHRQGRPPRFGVAPRGRRGRGEGMRLFGGER
jgi:hypothetical protein